MDKIVLIIAIVVALFLSGIILPGNNLSTEPSDSSEYVPVNPSVTGSESVLQMRNISFVTRAPVKGGSKIECDDSLGSTGATREPWIIYAVKPESGETIKSGDVIKVWYFDELPFGGGGIYLSDITSDPKNRSGEEQNGGLVYPLSRIFGPKHGEDANGRVLPPGAEPFPDKSNTLKNETIIENEYGNLIEWDVDSLSLKANHTYRVQILMHDGDGDTSMYGCINLTYK